MARVGKLLSRNKCNFYRKRSLREPLTGALAARASGLGPGSLQ